MSNGIFHSKQYLKGITELNKHNLHRIFVQVEDTIEWSDDVQPIGLPQQDSANPVGIPGFVTGWETGIQVGAIDSIADTVYGS